MSTATETLLTAEEFARLPDKGGPSELVRGKIIVLDIPTPRHGQICGRITRLVGNHVVEMACGHLINASGIVTGHDLDTVRGSGISYYSYSRVPSGPLPAGYLTVVPELVFEVRSPTDPWSDVLIKVGEFLAAGVLVVCVLDQMSETLQMFQQEEAPPRTLAGDEELHLPTILGDLRVRVRRFFE